MQNSNTPHPLYSTVCYRSNKVLNITFFVSMKIFYSSAVKFDSKIPNIYLSQKQENRKMKVL